MKRLPINRGRLFESLLKVIVEIHEEMEELNKTGIYFVPKSHLVFEIGKVLYKDRLSIFGTNEIKWNLEKILGNGIPIDLIFADPKETVLFKFNLSGIWDDFLKDINNLEHLEETETKTFRKYFIALADSSRDNQDPNTLKIRNQSGYRPIYEVSFPINNSNNDRDCILLFYEIASL